MSYCKYHCCYYNECSNYEMKRCKIYRRLEKLLHDSNGKNKVRLEKHP